MSGSLSVSFNNFTGEGDVQGGLLPERRSTYFREVESNSFCSVAWLYRLGKIMSHRTQQQIQARVRCHCYSVIG